jgi:hypothetical protein
MAIGLDVSWRELAVDRLKWLPIEDIRSIVFFNDAHELIWPA